MQGSASAARRLYVSSCIKAALPVVTLADCCYLGALDAKQLKIGPQPASAWRRLRMHMLPSGPPAFAKRKQSSGLAAYMASAWWGPLMVLKSMLVVLAISVSNPIGSEFWILCNGIQHRMYQPPRRLPPSALCQKSSGW